MNLFNDQGPAAPKKKKERSSEIKMISFSGGRTSAYMTKMLADELHPDEYIICFANTGKEHEATLKFVHDFETIFNLPVHWLEYCPTDGFKVVDYNSASRNGEPYAALIKKRRFVPNVVTRYCTTELKIRPIKKFMKSLGIKYWENVVGIRYDEPHRYAKLDKSCEKEPYESTAPLFKRKITKNNVLAYWERQSFDLEIPEHLGNCDMCFLKSRAKLKKIITETPEIADWWIEQEKLTGATFNKSISYEQMKMLVNDAPELFDSNIEVSCLCTID